MLVVERGWSDASYELWLARSLQRALLDDAQELRASNLYWAVITTCASKNRIGRSLVLRNWSACRRGGLISACYW